VTATARAETAARPVAEWDDLWRPSSWRRQPEWPREPGIQLVAILALVLYANVIVNEVLAPPWYVPFNLGLMAVALLLARSAGTSWVSMGMRVDRLRRGAGVGALVGITVIVVLVVAVAIPVSREAFRDERIVEGSLALSLYHALFRVPLGTGLYEEVLFRGIIFGVLARRTSVLGAALWSSLLFGVWHVLPALDAIEANPIGEAIGGTWVPVFGAVVSTFAVGLGFVWLRLYSGSILAPIMVHIAANSTALLAAAFVVYAL
jgi:CAAX protease family protein